MSEGREVMIMKAYWYYIVLVVVDGCRDQMTKGGPRNRIGDDRSMSFRDRRRCPIRQRIHTTARFFQRKPHAVQYERYKQGLLPILPK